MVYSFSQTKFVPIRWRRNVLSPLSLPFYTTLCFKPSYLVSLLYRFHTPPGCHFSLYSLGHCAWVGDNTRPRPYFLSHLPLSYNKRPCLSSGKPIIELVSACIIFNSYDFIHAHYGLSGLLACLQIDEQIKLYTSLC